jgi:hypothetical protein
MTTPLARCDIRHSIGRTAHVVLVVLTLAASIFTIGCPRPAHLRTPQGGLQVPTNTIVPTTDDGGPSVAPAAGRFAASSDGAATYSYPIWVPQGRAGIQPSLSLIYSSRNRNGLLGAGWSLQGLSVITRCRRDLARDGNNAAVQFTQDDAFCLDGQRLVVAPPSVRTEGTPECGKGDVVELRTEEDHFVRILSGPSDDKGPLWFEANSKDGRISCYGTTQDSRLEGQRFHSAPASLSGTTISTDISQTVRHSWALAEVRDRFGNNLTVQYSVTGDPTNQNGYEQLPKTIQS